MLQFDFVFVQTTITEKISKKIVAMPYCSVKWCNNKSSTSSYAKDGITFHRFPKNAVQKEKWLNAINKKNWVPTKYSVVCSKHFTPDCFEAIKNKRRVFSLALPTLLPVLSCPPLEPATSHTAESSCPPSEECCKELTSHRDKKITGFEHSAIQCNECGLDVVGFRYKCVQCADCDLCAACEARGAHPDHYVLRIPRPLQLAQAQALVERVRGCFEAQGLVEHREIKLEPIEHDIQSEFKVEEEELHTVKIEVMDAADEPESCEDPLDGLQPEPPSLQPGPPFQQPTSNTPLTPAPHTVHRKRKPQEPAAKIMPTKLLKPCPPTAISQAPYVTALNSPDIDLAQSGSGIYTEFGGHRQIQP